MKQALVLILLASSLPAFGQGRGRSGGPAGGPQGTGPGSAPGQMERDRDQNRDRGHAADRDGNHQRKDALIHQKQQPLKNSQINGGAFRMLEKRTGMTADQLKELYSRSGARNFGQFASAIVVSKNLNLDTQKVLDGLKTASLGETLKDLGVPSEKAKAEIKKAEKQIKDAGKSS